VAAIIVRKDAPSAISTGVKKLWNSQTLYTVYRFSELGDYPRRSFLLAPDRPARCFKIFQPSPWMLRDSAGLSLIEARGASEKCAKELVSVHISCTVFPQAKKFGAQAAIY